MTPNAELRLACGLLATLALITGQILFEPAESLRLLFDEHSQQTWLGWAMTLHGVCLILALILKCRPLRHWGLVLGCISWAALGMSLLSLWSLKPALPPLFVGMLYLAVLTASVQRKPRCNRL